MKRPFADEMLRNIPLFAGLSDEEMAEIRSAVVKKRYSKNEVVLQEKDTKNFMYFVYTGSLRVVHYTQDGKEQILAIHRRGDYFGEMALLDGKTLPAAVVAMVESTVGLLSRAEFERRLMGNAKTVNAILMMLCERLRDAWLRLRVLGLPDAEQRVRTVLRLLGLQCGCPCETGTLIDLRLTHENIAGYASVSRETVSRLLSRLSKEGEIEVTAARKTLLKHVFLEKSSIL